MFVGATGPLVLAMGAAAFLGTAACTRLLWRLPEARFRTGLKILMTLIAVELLVQALYDTFG